jgi:hypothetical protein
MLDDDAGRGRDGGIEGLDALPGRIGVGDVVVGKFFALDLLVAGDAARHHGRLAIEGGLLMRVLAIAQGLHLVEGELQFVREDTRLVLFIKRGQPVGDRRVVTGGMREGLLRQREAGFVDRPPPAFNSSSTGA